MVPVPPTSSNESGDTNVQPWQQGITYVTLAIILVFLLFVGVPPFGAGLLPPPFGFPLSNMVIIYFVF